MNLLFRRNYWSASQTTIVAHVLLFLVRGYQYFLSPFFGLQCRFTPSCSHYAVDALTKHGALKGSYLTLRRLLRCHPWHPGGYDAVPDPNNNGSPQ